MHLGRFDNRGLSFCGSNQRLPRDNLSQWRTPQPQRWRSVRNLLPTSERISESFRSDRGLQALAVWAFVDRPQSDTPSTVPDCGRGPTFRALNRSLQQPLGGQRPYLGQSNDLDCSRLWQRPNLSCPQQIPATTSGWATAISGTVQRLRLRKTLVRLASDSTAERLPDHWSFRRLACVGRARLFRGEQQVLLLGLSTNRMVACVSKEGSSTLPKIAQQRAEGRPVC